MFAKFSGTDDSSWDIGCICCCDCELLLESSVVPADADVEGGGTEVMAGGGGTVPVTAAALLVTIVLPGCCCGGGAVDDTVGVPEICGTEDSAGGGA